MNHLERRCKECARIRAREHYRKNRETRLAWQKTYYEDHREERLEYASAYRKENR